MGWSLYRVLAAGKAADLVELLGLGVVARDTFRDTKQRSIELLDGELPASAGPCTVFIDPLGRPLAPVSVAGVRRRDRRRF